MSNEKHETHDFVSIINNFLANSTGVLLVLTKY